MLRKVFGASFVVAAMALVPTFAKADFQAGNWELTLGGAGTANRQVSAGQFNVEAGLGYFVTKDIEVAFRQTVGYSDFNAGTVTTASSALALDYHFDLGNFKPFIGGNVAYSYGSGGVKDTWAIAPEAGLKYFINSTTFAYGIVAYEVEFAGQSHSGGANFDKGEFVYQIGLGVALK